MFFTLNLMMLFVFSNWLTLSSNLSAVFEIREFKNTINKSKLNRRKREYVLWFFLCIILKIPKNWPRLRWVTRHLVEHYVPTVLFSNTETAMFREIWIIHKDGVNRSETSECYPGRIELHSHIVVHSIWIRW